jgi:hypothetical protein
MFSLSAFLTAFRKRNKGMPIIRRMAMAALIMIIKINRRRKKQSQDSSQERREYMLS